MIDDLNSEVEDILEFESDHRTDVSSDSGYEPIRISMLSRRRRHRKNVSESSNDGQLLHSEDVGSNEQQLAVQLIMPLTNNLKGRAAHKWRRRSLHFQDAVKYHSYYSRTQYEAKNANSPFNQFKLFISEAIVNIIVLNTNKEIAAKKASYAEQTAPVRDTEEISALIGLLLLSVRKIK